MLQFLEKVESALKLSNKDKFDKDFHQVLKILWTKQLESFQV